MLTEKENLLQLLKPGGMPERLVNQYGPFVGILNDPIGGYTMGMGRDDGKDAWGVSFFFREDEPGRMPLTDAQHKVLTDITQWRSQVTIPDIAANCSDPALWKPCQAEVERIRAEGNIPMVVIGGGLFERLHYLMGFEDTLMNLLLEPEDMQDLIEAMAENRLLQVQMLVDMLHPDAILFHDDWGSKQNLFMSPETWRAFFKEPYRRIYSYARDHGVIVLHHADSHCTVIAQDMAEIGIQIWQGVLPQNDIAGLQERLEGKMILMGGIDAAIVDRADATEGEIRAEARRALREYGPGGSFIPCTTQGLPRGTIDPKTYDIISDEIFKYNTEVYGAAGLPADKGFTF